MQTQENLKLAYLISFVVLILLETIMLLTGIKISVIDQTTSINLQQILILLILVCIPGVLVWSKKKVSLIHEIESLEKRLEEYKKIELTRLIVYDFLGLLTLIVQLLSDLKGLEMLYLIILCLFMFIWPTMSRLEHETGALKEDAANEDEKAYGEAEEEEEEEEEEKEQ